LRHPQTLLFELVMLQFLWRAQFEASQYSLYAPIEYSLEPSVLARPLLSFSPKDQETLIETALSLLVNLRPMLLSATFARFHSDKWLHEVRYTLMQIDRQQ